MVFCRVVKTKAYHRRFQTKYRRRREGKTDYRARKNLIIQDKNKYNSPKFRFVVRRTNTRVICQVVQARLQGDKMIASASSSELPHYGVKVGLTNYSASYATGLLCARRALKAMGLAEASKPAKEFNGEDYNVNESFEGEGRPLKCLLDVGIVRTTVGNRAFGAMKGACDGGLYIPHSTAKFPGGDKAKGDSAYDPAKHKDKIYGKHVSDYMKLMEGEDPEKFKTHFSEYIKHGITAAKMEPMYRDAFKAIIDKPDPQPKTTKKAEHKRVGDYIQTPKGKYPRPKKLTHAERRERVASKIQALAKAAAE